MPMHPWTVVVWSEFVSLVSCILLLLRQFRAATYHQQLRIQTRQIGRWLTSIKFWRKIDRSGLAVCFSPGMAWNIRAWNCSWKKRRKFLGGSGGMLPWKIFKVETKICAIWGILEANLKKSSTLMFMMNSSFVPSICNHRSTIFIFIIISIKKISKKTNKQKKLNTFPDNCSKLNIPHFSHCVSVCVTVCVCVCVCVEREREREREREKERGREREREGERKGGGGERERTVSFPRPAYPKIHLSVLQTVCVRIFRFMIGLFSLFCLALLFFADVPPIRQDKKVSKGNFSFIYLSRTVCELTFSIKQTH